MNTVIIVAAGQGTRFGSGQPKQFLDLRGKPVIFHTLEQFERCDAIDDVVLVLSESGRDEFQTTKLKPEISKLRAVVTGGATRGESVRNGFAAVDPGTGIVVVHDGARPLVSVEEIARTIEKADETGAACLVAEVTDTIKSVENGRITGTVDRTSLRRALTPQAFRYHILARALADTDLSETATDECFLVEQAGIEIAMVEGSTRNIKITNPEDLILAETMIAIHDD